MTRPSDKAELPDFREFRLTVDPGAGPISGSLGPPDGPPVRFAGWLDLASVIDSLITASSQELHTGRPHQK